MIQHCISLPLCKTVLSSFKPPKEFLEAYSNHTVHPSVVLSVPLCVWCISPIFFEIGIPNLVSGCILGWLSVLYFFQVIMTLTSDLVFRIFMSLAPLLYCICGRNPNPIFGVCMHLGMSSVLYHPGVRSISLIFLEVGIPNLVCIFILGWRNVTYNFQVTVTLTSDLVLRTIVSGVYLLYYLR